MRNRVTTSGERHARLGSRGRDRSAPPPARNLEVIKSTAYGRDRTRESYWMYVRYTNEHCIGRTLFFVLASWDSSVAAAPPPAPAAPPPMRFAACDLYVAKDRMADGGGAIYVVPDVRPVKRFEQAAAGIRMTSIHSKVVRCFADSPNSGESTFCKYPNFNYHTAD